MKSNTSMSLVSVLMPCYNHRRYVKEAILSVLNQSHKNIELIVIDDGSTDGSWDEIENLLLENKFLAIRRENKGLIATLKELIALANGEYITVLASDDRFYVDKIKILLAAFETNLNAGLCIGHTDRIDENGNVLELVRNEYEGKGNLHSLLKEGRIYVSYVSTLVNAKAYKQVEFINDYIEDLPAWLQISRDWPIVASNAIVGSHRQTTGSMSHNFEKMINEEKKIISHFSGNRTPYPVGWCIRWLNTYMLLSSRSAIKFFFSNECSLSVLCDYSFYKRLIRVLMLKFKNIGLT